MEMTETEKRKNMICEFVAQESYIPMKEKELAMLLQVSREERPELRRILEELLAEGKLVSDVHGKYSKPDGNVLTGTFISHAKGFGFVEVEGQEDLFVPQEMTGGAFHRDRVLVALTGGKQSGGARENGVPTRTQARVLRILERGITRVVGTYQKSKSYGFVVPDNSRLPQDIFVPQERSKGAVTGHKVVVEITDYGDGGRSPEGKVVEILGHVNDPGVDILSIVRGYELPEEFGEKVLHQAQRVAGEVTEADMAGRRDLRDRLLITIDGEDAKDLDDAVGVYFDGTDYHLEVHIADVTNYVQEGSALDREALERGTSVYLVDRVIPMLPHTLSNGICSLNAGEDRLALSCLMTIDAEGNIRDYEICESVICVRRRMSYSEVKRLLTEEGAAADGSVSAQEGLAADGSASVQEGLAADGSGSAQGGLTADDSVSVQEGLAADDSASSRYAELLPMLREMETLSGLLRKKRRERGGIDFDFPECKIVLDREGRPLDILPYERNVATDIIEDFMLAANETVAQHFYWLELPFLYRVHEAPDRDRIQKLAAFLRNFGYYMKNIGQTGGRAAARGKGRGRAAQPADIHPKEIQKLLRKVDGTPEEPLISRLTLRSMKQAKYSAVSSGHFGLACPFYCHFTSPIRRYPDLQIHRIIKEYLRGRLSDERIRHYRDILPDVASRCSRLERRADEAERETDKLKKVQYMEKRLGEVYQGVISGVTAWGIYVELPNTVEGLVHVSRLPGDYYCYHEDTYEMVGETTGRTFGLGQPVTVQVAGTDRMLRTIDFDLA